MRISVLIAAALTLTFVLGCVDDSEYCADWKASGWCEEYKDQLKDLCAKSCGFCGSSGGDGEQEDPGTAIDKRPARIPDRPNLCSDTCSTKDCETFKSRGDCEGYSAVMTQNCASTCGWCGARLCSPPDVENGWSDFEMIMVPAGATANIYCYEGYKSWGASEVTCNTYGELDGSPSCVAMEESDSLSMGTSCSRAAEAASTEKYKDGNYVVPQASTDYIPQCDYSGNFNQVQYDGGKGETFCVDTYSGMEVQGTRIRGQHEYIQCTPGAAAEYYERIAAERAYNSPSDDSSSSYGYEDVYEYESGYDQGGYEQGGYEQGGYEQGGYEQGGYEQSGYDAGDSGFDNTYYAEEQPYYEYESYYGTGEDQGELYYADSVADEGYYEDDVYYDQEEAVEEEEEEAVVEEEAVEEGVSAINRRRRMRNKQRSFDEFEAEEI